MSPTAFFTLLGDCIGTSVISTLQHQLEYQYQIKDMNQITKREQEVLHLISYEHSSKEIANKLFVSYETIISHRKNIMRKLDVKNVAGLVRAGFEYGFLRTAIVLFVLVGTLQHSSAQSIGLQVDGVHDVLFGNTIEGSTENRLLWLSSKAAIRAGKFTNVSSQIADIQEGSVIFGKNNVATGFYAMSWGLNNGANGIYASAWGNAAFAEGQTSTAFGRNVKALGSESTAWGEQNEAIGDHATSWGGHPSVILNNGVPSFFIGWGNEAKGNISTVWGFGNVANSFNETLLGRWAETTMTNNDSTWVDSHQLFAIGNGTSDTDRNNALTVLKNGNTEVSAFTKLGSEAPGIKIKKITGTTPSSEGQAISFAHGIMEEEKIISATAVIRYNIFGNDSAVIPPGGNTGISETTYGFRLQGSSAIVQLSPSDSGVITNREVVITIMYEE